MAVATRQHADRHCLWASAVICSRLHSASLLKWVLTLGCLCSLCCGAPTHTHTLPSLRAAGEEVSGHLAFPLHLDETATVQLVSIAVQHVVKVCGHLTKDTDIDKVSHVLSKQNTSISSSDQAVNKLNVVQSGTK